MRTAPPLCLLSLATQATLAVSVATRNHAAPSVVVVQGTNRQMPLFLPSQPQELLEWDKSSGGIADWLSAMQVAAYAERHKYAYRLYQYNSTYDAACHHPVRGPLQAQWCKILAIKMAYEAFPEADLVAWLDTDVYITNASKRLEDYIAATPVLQQPPRTAMSEQSLKMPLPSCNVSEKRASHEDISILVSRNGHWDGSCSPNTGIVFLRRSPAADRFLKSWWDVAMDPKMPGPFDQGFVSRVWYPSHPEEVGVFADDTSSGNAKLLLHRCGKCSWLPAKASAFLKLGGGQLAGPGGLTALLKGLESKVDRSIVGEDMRMT